MFGFVWILFVGYIWVMGVKEEVMKIEGNIQDEGIIGGWSYRDKD